MSKVLLVEDDNNLREIYEARLQAEGYQIVTAHDGEEALVVAKAEKPDLIISDVMMPKISGFEMLDILRNTEGLQAVKVIMLTALGQTDDQQRADRLGADRYLVKSQVTLEDIVNVAHELLSDGGAPAADKPVVAAAATPEPPSSSAPATLPEPASDSAALSPEPAQPTQLAPASDPIATPADPPVDTPALVIEEPTESTPPETASAEVPLTETPAPEPAPDTAEPAVDEAATEANSAAQEEAAMEAKIENFVDGATTEAPPPEIPAQEPALAPEPPSSSAPATLPEPVSDSAALSPEPAQPAAPAETPEQKEQALSEAVDKMMSTEQPGASDEVVPEPVPQPQAAPAAPAQVPAPASPVPEPVPAPAPNPAQTSDVASPPVTDPEDMPSGSVQVVKSEPVSAEPQEDLNHNTQIAGRKVIQPIDSAPKRDINALLAAEESKNGPVAPKAIIVNDETGATETQLNPGAEVAPEATDFANTNKPADKSEGDQPVDPNSIAL